MEKHIPVLLKESISLLSIQKEGVYVDCTFGSGGHSEQILKILAGTGKLVSFDYDYLSLQWAKEISESNFFFINDNFANLNFHLDNLGIKKVDGFLFDLGISSMQLSSKRGFSYQENSPLDMRMNINDNLKATDIVNNYSLDEMTNIFYHFGEEKKAYKIAKVLFNYRRKKAIENSQELTKITASVIGKQKGKRHPSKKIFQALRIKVNKELDNLQTALNHCLNYLSENGRVIIISYHSLEDRIVKKFFNRKLNEGFILLCKKPILPTYEELTKNNRSRSAKLRILIKKDNY